MNRSESIGKLAEAMSKAQGQLKGAIKDTSNPFYNRKYADLASVWDACREALSANGLAVAQMTDQSERGTVIVDTLLFHSSGEWLSGRTEMRPVREKKGEGFVDANDPQAIGSCISYARRYTLAAMVGVYQEDDDANAASAPSAMGIKPPQRMAKPEISEAATFSQKEATDRRAHV